MNPGTGAARREREVLGPDDADALDSFTRALDGAAPIGFARAMEAALAAAGGDVNGVEIGIRGATPIYEVKAVNGGRIRSVKVNALTGDVIEF